MPLKLILVMAVATAVGCYAIKSNAAQSDSETLLTEVSFAQVFADVERPPLRISIQIRRAQSGISSTARR